MQKAVAPKATAQETNAYQKVWLSMTVYRRGLFGYNLPFESGFSPAQLVSYNPLRNVLIDVIIYAIQI